MAPEGRSSRYQEQTAWRLGPRVLAALMAMIVVLPAAGIASAQPDSTTTASEEQECVTITVSLTPGPRKGGYTMYHAGIRTGTIDGPKGEIIKGTYWARNLPDGSETGQPDCSGIRRVENAELEMQSARNRKVWVDLTPQIVHGHLTHPRNIPLTNRPHNPEGIVRVGPGGWFANLVTEKRLYNQCPDGKHWLKVRAKTTLFAQEIQTGKILGSREYIWPVKVRGSCAAAARSARKEAAGIAKFHDEEG